MAADGEVLESLLVQMREAFGERQWDTTIELFGELNEFGKMPRNMRVEATCLAARSMISLQNRPGARKLLNAIVGTEYAKAAPYAHLAQAYMDLKNYREVIRLCERIVAFETAIQQRKAS